jgi:N-acetylglucosamine transport system substrate-binding protein
LNSEVSSEVEEVVVVVVVVVVDETVVSTVVVNTVVTGSTEGIELGPGLTSVTKMISGAGKNTFNWLYSTYYRKLERNLVNAAAADLFAKRINSAQFVEQCQKGADEIAKDDTIKKFKRV